MNWSLDMIAEKKNSLRPILESFNGIHLTAYLVNRGTLLDLKSQIRKTIREAHEWLYGIKTEDEVKKFLEPLDSLLQDPRILKGIKGNVGIFRNESSFQLLNIPIDVEPSTQVASSFHIKPILRWLQGDKEFLLLGLEKGSAHLYFGSQNTFKLIDSILFPEFFRSTEYFNDFASLQKIQENRLKEYETFSWLNDWIFELTQTSKPRLFIAGEPALVKSLERKLNYPNKTPTPAANFFSQNKAIDIYYEIKKQLREETKTNISKSLQEFRKAEEKNRTQKNIFHISEAVVQGKVKKLIITDELNIFGKVDQKSGGISIHPRDLDHEDDCVLDDLAQLVLSKGGEVIIAKRNEIPQGRPILAIIDDDEEILVNKPNPKQEFNQRGAQ